MGLKRYALPDEVWVLVARRRHPRARPFLMGVFSGRDAAFAQLLEHLGPRQYDALDLCAHDDGALFEGEALVRSYSAASGMHHGRRVGMYYRLQRGTVDDPLATFRRLTVPREGPFVPAWAAHGRPYRAVIAWCAERRTGGLPRGG